jgi:pyruvate/2-oxoglutarate dehydrogenase complex dihydrolipoamide dehydrogenase (E3) component
MVTPQHYDAIIIGSGQAGGPLATALAHAGWKVAIIEREHVGGTCINYGCTPTKTMVASARVAYLSRRSRDYGITVGEVRVDMAAVRERKRRVVDSFRNGSERRLTTTPAVDLVFGDAEFAGPASVTVRRQDGERLELTGGKIFINAGARPSAPPVPGLAEVPALDSTSIMELDTVPDHLLVLGGGYVGLEFGQMFRRFGSRVTIVERGDRVLAREDVDVADAVAKILRDDGIDIRLNTDTVRVAGTPNGKIELVVREGSRESTLSGSHLLVAAGRTPNVERLNLPAAGVNQDGHGYIQTNDRLETNVPGIYALGDVKGGPAFTHISYDDFRIIRDNLLGDGHASTKDRLVPYSVFIDPQLGRVGLSEAEARAQGRNIRVARIPMDYVSRAVEIDEARGFMKAIVDAETHAILGCAVLGIEGGELMAMLEIAMLGKVPYDVLKDAIFAHPTLAESLNTLFSTFQEG